jgi:hypothetical protein
MGQLSKGDDAPVVRSTATTKPKYTVTRLVLVASVAAVVGVFVALLVYATLVVALIFLLVAIVTAIAMKARRRV